MIKSFFKSIPSRFYKIAVLALLVHGFFFFLLPYLNYLNRNRYVEKKPKVIKAEVKSTKIEKKQQKKKVKRLVRKTDNTPSKNSRNNNNLRANRFNVNVNAKFSGAGSGLAVGGGGGANIVYSENDVDVLPYKVSGENPQAPDDFNLGGVVQLIVVTDEQGNVIKVTKKTEDPEGYGLANICINAVWNWRYRPGMLKNIPVKVEGIVTIEF